MQHSKKAEREYWQSGFTIIELLVSVTTISALIALILPAVQKSRETARRMTCQSNLRQLSLATMNFESTYGVFPLGTIHKKELLPFLGETAAFAQLKANDSSGEKVDSAIEYLTCPSDPGQRSSDGMFGSSFGTSYHGNSGTGVLKSGFNGIFGYGEDANQIFPDKKIKVSDVTDGMSNTAMYSEALLPASTWSRVSSIWITPVEYYQSDELEELANFCDSIPRDPEAYSYGAASAPRGFPWHGGGMGTALYNHTLPPNRPSCTNGATVLTGVYSVSSMHPNGVNVAFADGHIQFVSEDINLGVWQEFGSRGGEIQPFPF